VALANGRWLALADGQVTFRLKDYRRGNRRTTPTLHAREFIRRFLLHLSAVSAQAGVWPDGFVPACRQAGACATSGS
jgi:hypothetical protein